MQYSIDSIKENSSKKINNEMIRHLKIIFKEENYKLPKGNLDIVVGGFKKSE